MTVKNHRSSGSVIPIERFLELHNGCFGHQFEVSSLVNDSFPGTFNASGFHEPILELKPGEQGYGVDNCMRHLDFDSADDDHKAAFHMGIFATSVERQRDGSGNFTDPGKHAQFFEFQRAVTDQFISIITSAGVRLDEVTVTFFAGAEVGNGISTAGS